MRNVKSVNGGKRAVLLALTLALGVPAHALQTTSMPKAPRPAPAVEPIALEELLEGVRATHGVAALGAALVHGGVLAGIGVAGVRARGSEERVTRADPWHLGSCTKAMTATLLAVLDEREELALDATLDALFPELADEMQADWKRVTLVQVLQHRAGFVENPLALWAKLTEHPDGPVAARAMLASELLVAPPDHPSGTFVYSNSGYAVAGAAAERATGKSFEELLRQHVFEPLGMQSAGFGPPGSADALDAPRGHQNEKPVAPGPGADNPAWLGPAGTVHASLADWGKFAALHLAGARGEETAILSTEAFERLHAPASGSGSRYACGWLVEPRGWAGGDVLMHAGSNTLWRAVVFVAPEVDLALLAVCNEADSDAAKACDEAVQLVLARWTAQSLLPR